MSDDEMDRLLGWVFAIVLVFTMAMLAVPAVFDHEKMMSIPRSYLVH